MPVGTIGHGSERSDSPEMGAALFRSPTSSSNSEANTEDGSLMDVVCQAGRESSFFWGGGFHTSYSFKIGKNADHKSHF